MAVIAVSREERFNLARFSQRSSTRITFSTLGHNGPPPSFRWDLTRNRLHAKRLGGVPLNRARSRAERTFWLQLHRWISPDRRVPAAKDRVLSISRPTLSILKRAVRLRSREIVRWTVRTRRNRGTNEKRNQPGERERAASAMERGST